MQKSEKSLDARPSIMLCPYNAHHKIENKRDKFKFHVAKCKERCGRSLYICKFDTSHMFTDSKSMISHELT